MKKTVLITGSSTGIGRATAKYFQQKGWNVVATMRTPAKETELNQLPNVLVTALDVTDTASVAAAIEAGIAKFGQIDVVVNNAGYGLTGVFEGTDDAQIRRQFDTNVFGLMTVVRAILPHFRARRSGTIVNISSMGGRIVFPFYSVYHATKWAVEGFTESLRFEVEPLGIHVRLVEPGAIRTDFYDRSADQSSFNDHPDYRALTEKPLENMNRTGAKAPGPDIVAKTVYRAATARGRKLRFPVGTDSKAILAMRRFIPDSLYASMIWKGLNR